MRRPPHASAKKAKRYPVITSVRPMEANIGDTITIRGRYFKPGRGKNSVVFKRDGGRAVFVKADVGTKKLLKVKLPAKLTSSLSVVNGAPTTTRFRLRVLARRLGKSFTSGRQVAAHRPGRPAAAAELASRSRRWTPTGTATATSVANRDDADDDNDGLDDGLARECPSAPTAASSTPTATRSATATSTAPRSTSTTTTTGHPAQSLPFPGKRPYPNALDGEDAGTDYDGDGLTLGDEYGLWQYTIGNGASASLDALSYSDGLKCLDLLRDANGIRRPALDARRATTRPSDFTDWMTAQRLRDGAAARRERRRARAPPARCWTSTAPASSTPASRTSSTAAATAG